MMPVRRTRPMALMICCALSGTLAGCASLPTSGPTAGQIVHQTRSSANTIGMHIVDIDPKVVSDEAASTASADSKMPTIATITGVPHNDAVGPGDELAIRIYEVGSSLFGSSGGG